MAQIITSQLYIYLFIHMYIHVFIPFSSLFVSLWQGCPRCSSPPRLLSRWLFVPSSLSLFICIGVSPKGMGRWWSSSNATYHTGWRPLVLAHFPPTPDHELSRAYAVSIDFAKFFNHVRVPDSFKMRFLMRVAGLSSHKAHARGLPQSLTASVHMAKLFLCVCTYT